MYFSLISLELIPKEFVYDYTTSLMNGRYAVKSFTSQIEQERFNQEYEYLYPTVLNFIPTVEAGNNISLIKSLRTEYNLTLRQVVTVVRYFNYNYHESREFISNNLDSVKQDIFQFKKVQ